MSFHGRSLDDQPLAAYSTGISPTDDEPEVPPDPGYTSVPASSHSTADNVAHAHAEPDAAATPAPSGRKLGLKLRLPSFGRGRQPALEAAAPFQAVAPSAQLPGRPFEPASPRPFEPAAQRPFEPVSVHVPVDGAASPSPLARLPKLPVRVRDPRVLAGGTVAVGLVLLVASLLGGGGPTSGAGGPNSSQRPGGAAFTAAPVGNATVELIAGGTGMFTLNSASGAGPAVNSRVEASWADSLGHGLSLSGLASQGTRTTDANFALTWTMDFGGTAVTFTSRAAECTVGMAVGVTAVKGTFVCKKLRSPDGKHTIDIRGTYTT